MKIGDEVHYKQEFLYSISGFDAEVANRVGVIKSFKIDNKYAVVDWDDGATSTAKVSNLSKTRNGTQSTRDDYQKEILQKRREMHMEMYLEFYGIDKLIEKLSA